MERTWEDNFGDYCEAELNKARRETYTEAQKEKYLVHCNITTCVNYKPGIGSSCPECKMLWRAFIAMDINDITFAEYVATQQAEEESL